MEVAWSIYIASMVSVARISVLFISSIWFGATARRGERRAAARKCSGVARRVLDSRDHVSAVPRSGSPIMCL